MKRLDFENHLKALHNLDKAELVEAGVNVSDDRQWVAFRTDPAGWMIRADDENANRLWALVERRCKPRVSP